MREPFAREPATCHVPERRLRVFIRRENPAALGTISPVTATNRLSSSRCAHSARWCNLRKKILIGWAFLFVWGFFSSSSSTSSLLWFLPKPSRPEPGNTLRFGGSSRSSSRSQTPRPELTGGLFFVSLLGNCCEKSS